ncbi:hypothetical protein Tsubulata_010610 [Turnera subulata]|uniref:Fanconi Anaemia group E protein C-terminal domain-containing protein n=1 Tax=Turnera subulata TaxID=218843 RepID=A0A9Q0J2L5_9ROSI|nr:hypothetical protein Tsubulata_010610 [Turnera subulata]
MDQWVPLFDIFLHSPTPETQASLWLQQAFNATVSSSSASPPSTTPITTASFLSLLARPIDAISTDAAATKRLMFIQTLPGMVQSRIFSFLALERDRFCKRDLCRLARGVLAGDREVDFWVTRAARHLLDQLSGANYEWISGLSLDSGGEGTCEEFDSVPDWLKDTAASGHEMCLSWLPVSVDDLRSRELFGTGCESEDDLLSQVGDGAGENVKEEDMDKMEIDCDVDAHLGQGIDDLVASLKARVMNFESAPKTEELADEIRKLCLQGVRGGDSLSVLGLIEPWKADDETASVLISCLSKGDEEALDWSSQVLCTIMLPKLLVLQGPASRVLVTALVDYCRLHHTATEYALLFPLIMGKDGINTPICDVVTKIVKECLHPAHVSAFCQKLLCGGEAKERIICLPCHRCLIANELVWTESLFNLFYNILNHNVQLTQDSVDQLVLRISELSQSFSKSLKFGNFLLCFITKCALALRSHKLLLTEAVEQTNTLVTKSTLSKLESL